MWRLHGLAEEGVDPGLVAGARALEPGEDVAVNANGDGALDWAIELANDGAGPVGEFGRVGEIDFVVREASEVPQFFGFFSRRPGFHDRCVLCAVTVTTKSSPLFEKRKE